MSGTDLASVLDLENLERRIEEGFIARKKHPDADLFILNYTAAAQYTPGIMLDPAVRVCRGLVVDGDNKVVARPFPKFHNVSEHLPVSDQERAERLARGLPERLVPPPLPTGEPFEVFAKADGSLGVHYTLDGVSAIATRGSFISEQAQWATDHFHENYAGVVIPEGQTYLFEVVYPANRIVVQYDFAGLILLAVIDNATGLDLPVPSDWPGPVIERFDFDDFEAVAALAGTDPEGSANSEGFVIRFASGVRAKVKFAEYIRLHRIMTGITTRTVYEHLGAARMRDHHAAGPIGFALGMPADRAQALMDLPDPVNELLENVPDELYAWLEAQIAQLERALADTAAEVESRADEIRSRGLTDQRSIAAAVKENDKELQGLIFSALSGGRYDNRIWKMIRPAHAKAFSVDIDS